MSKKDITPVKGISYWFVAIPYDKSLIPFQEVKNEELNRLFKDKDSTLGMNTFYSDYDKSFVHNAKINDFVINLMWINGKYIVIPPREIINIGEISIRKHFFLETKKGQIDKGIGLKEFKVKLNEQKINLEINTNTIIKIPKKYVPEIISIW